VVLTQMCNSDTEANSSFFSVSYRRTHARKISSRPKESDRDSCNGAAISCPGVCIARPVCVAPTALLFFSVLDPGEWLAQLASEEETERGPSLRSGWRKLYL